MQINTATVPSAVAVPAVAPASDSAATTSAGGLFALFLSTEQQSLVALAAATGEPVVATADGEAPAESSEGEETTADSALSAALMAPAFMQTAVPETLVPKGMSESSDVPMTSGTRPPASVVATVVSGGPAATPDASAATTPTPHAVVGASVPGMEAQADTASVRAAIAAAEPLATEGASRAALPPKDVEAAPPASQVVQSTVVDAAPTEETPEAPAISNKATGVEAVSTQPGTASITADSADDPTGKQQPSTASAVRRAGSGQVTVTEASAQSSNPDVTPEESVASAGKPEEHGLETSVRNFSRTFEQMRPASQKAMESTSHGPSDKPTQSVSGLEGATTKAAVELAKAVTATPSTGDAPQAGAVHDVALKGVRYLVSNGEKQLTVHLSPPSLGDLTIEVSAKADGLHIRLTASQPLVRDALESQLHTLRDSLGKEGIDASRVTVTADATAGQSFGNSTGRHATYEGGTNRDMPASHLKSLLHEAPAVTAPRLGARHRGALDLYV